MGIGKDIFGCRYFGFQGCLGYDYDKETKELVINEEEAKVVRFIFESYNQGKGARLIGKELKDKGYKTKRGSNNWPDSTIRGILKNDGVVVGMTCINSKKCYNLKYGRVKLLAFLNYSIFYNRIGVCYESVEWRFLSGF